MDKEKDKEKSCNIYTYLLKANRYSGIITICVSILTAILLGIFRLCTYCYSLGVLEYWNIDSSYINVNNNNSLYSVVFQFGIICSILISNAITFIVWKYSETLKIKIIKTLTIIILISFVIIFIIAYTIPIESFDGISSVQFNEVISVIISILLIAAEFIIWGIILGYEKEKSSKNDNKSCETIVTSIWQRKILFIIIIFISVIVLAFSFNNIGRIQSENMTQFKIVRDTYFDDNNTCHVVVYETKDAYILSDALIYDNNIYINKETQTIQDKNSLDMIIKNFNATNVLSNEEYDNKVKALKE